MVFLRLDTLNQSFISSPDIFRLSLLNITNQSILFSYQQCSAWLLFWCYLELGSSALPFGAGGVCSHPVRRVPHLRHKVQKQMKNPHAKSLKLISSVITLSSSISVHVTPPPEHVIVPMGLFMSVKSLQYQHYTAQAGMHYNLISSLT